jgi:hypothetical protein
MNNVLIYLNRLRLKLTTGMNLRKKGSLPITPAFLIILSIAFSIFIILNVTESFSQKDESIDISFVNSSFIPLTNTDANQVKVNVEYMLEDEKMQNQIINAVMEVYAPNGTLIRTSTASGFTVQSDGGERVLRTTLHDKSLQSVSIKIVFTDLTKKIPLSNAITDDLKLEDSSTTD